MYESKLEKTSLAETFNKLISRTNQAPPLPILELSSIRTKLNCDFQMFG